jgi:hypothetical protein
VAFAWMWNLFSVGGEWWSPRAYGRGLGNLRRVNEWRPIQLLIGQQERVTSSPGPLPRFAKLDFSCLAWGGGKISDESSFSPGLGNEGPGKCYFEIEWLATNDTHLFPSNTDHDPTFQRDAVHVPEDDSGTANGDYGLIQRYHYYFSASQTCKSLPRATTAFLHGYAPSRNTFRNQWTNTTGDPFWDAKRRQTI